NKESNIFKNIITVLLALLVFGMLAGTASADLPIDIVAIAGVTAPVTGATPVSTIAETGEYTATIGWSPADATFVGSTVYTATITIIPKVGYTLTGVIANFFTVAGATATNGVDSGVVTAVFPTPDQIAVLVAQYTNAVDAPTVETLLDANVLTLDLTNYAGLDPTGETEVASALFDVKGTLTTLELIQAAVTPAIATAKPASDARILAAAKTTAHGVLTTALATYTEVEYTGANWITLTGFKTDGDTAIDAAADLAAVTSAQDTATSGMDGVETIAETLAAAKVTAHGVLTTAYESYTEADYTGANWITLTGFKTAGDTAIDAAADLAAVTSAQDTATS
ncbi:MAG: hypothetical protein Q8M92_05020, partial [Candidatus Subteraquimicrobiales bacterium]|nr:hypothetical protein [Candidatus Subteraquimicrobiales bacterium]